MLLFFFLRGLLFFERVLFGCDFVVMFLSLKFVYYFVMFFLVEEEVWKCEKEER